MLLDLPAAKTPALTKLFRFPYFPTTSELLSLASNATSLPLPLLVLSHGNRRFRFNDDKQCIPDNVIVAKVEIAGGLKGGKGGFGAMLRSMGKGAGSKTTTDFGACRDLNGRRLRHVNDEIKLHKWAEAKEQERKAKGR